MFQHDDDLINEIRENWNKNIRSMRIWGIIASIFMIVVGILCVVFPMTTTYVIEVMASIALLLFGIWEVVRYVKRSSFLRTGVSLASGILNILLAVLLLTSPKAEMLLFFGFLFGLNLLMIGFEMVTAAGRFRAVGIAETGWMMANGVINIIIGIILLLIPLASIAAVSILLAVYLIFGGITLLMMSINARDMQA